MEIENGESKAKMEDYEIVEQIGRGAFGAAFLVLHKTENKKYVMKKIRLSKQSEKFKRTAHQEMNLIAKLNHPYIVEFKDAWVDKGSCICIVTQYCEGGDVSEMLRRARGAYFSEEKICKWLTQLLLAIDYLHSNRVLHRDLKLSNIFVTKENDIRLGDFGLAKLLNEEALASSVVGTPNYMCPEILADLPYGYKSDIWSLGCCMFEIAAHQQAFKAPDLSGLINKINRSLISPMPIVYSSTLKQIIKTMLRKSPEHRPTAAELLRHPHLQPFLLRCHNPSTVFLPVKSPSPKIAKEKIKKSSPSSSGGRKVSGEREVKLKQKELLPLFDENANVHYPSLLDDDAFVEDRLETKRVDPTSYSGQISHDSEDSKSGGTSCETTACNGDNQDNFDSLSLKESFSAMDPSLIPSNALSEEQTASPKHTTNLEGAKKGKGKATNVEPSFSPQVSEEIEIRANDSTLEKCSRMAEPNPVCSVKVESFPKEITPLSTDNLISNVDVESRSSFISEENAAVSGVCHDEPTEMAETCLNEDTAKVEADTPKDLIRIEKEDIQLMSKAQHDKLLNTIAAIGRDASKGEPGIPGQQRAEALESLLELCARLLKQDKFDELSGVLKPFGEEVVSSRETAIWLTKSLINAQKLAKEP